jgi:hypothetical protein
MKINFVFYEYDFSLFTTIYFAIPTQISPTALVPAGQQFVGVLVNSAVTDFLELQEPVLAIFLITKFPSHFSAR